MVIEINIAIAVAAVLVGLLLPASQWKFKPVPLEANPALLVAPAAAVASAPAGWTVAPQAGGGISLRKAESAWTAWVVPALIVATVVTIFTAALYWPYWLALVLLGATWWYGLESAPGLQSVKIGADGAIELKGAVRHTAVIGGSERVAAQEIETVFVHKEHPEVYLVYQRDKERRGWRIYAETPAEAHAIAALVQSHLKPPPPPPLSGGKK
jgi:hypothetical protein